MTGSAGHGPTDRDLADAFAEVVTGVPCVARLAPRLHERVGAALRNRPDSAAVDVSRVRGDLRVEVRVVVTMSRPPALTLRAVADALRVETTRLLPDVADPEIVVTVVDVVP